MDSKDGKDSKDSKDSTDSTDYIIVLVVGSYLIIDGICIDLKTRKSLVRNLVTTRNSDLTSC